MIDDHDPYCQGVIVLGLNGSIDSLSRAFDVAALQPRVKGFAVGRTIFGETAKSWMAGQIDNQTAASQLRSRYREIITAWDRARSRLQPVN